MKRRIILIIIICLFKMYGFSQSSILINGGGGVNKIFISSPKTRTGIHSYFGLGADLYKGSQTFHFLPSLTFCRNIYSTKLEETIFLNVKQSDVNLNLLVGIQAGKKIMIQSGLFINYLVFTDCLLRYKNVTGGSTWYGTKELSKYYYPNHFQAGVVIGVSTPLNKSGSVYFDFQYRQNAISVFRETYLIKTLDIDKIAFNEKSIPAFLTAGLSFKLRKKAPAAKPVKKER